MLSVWNDQGGELRGTGVLSEWARLQANVQENLAGDRKDGSFDLTVNTLAGCHEQPTQDQIAAYSHLQNNDHDVFSAILQAILADYSWMQDDFAASFSAEDARRLAPCVSTKEDLLPLLAFGSMTVHRISKGGIAYVGFSFVCTWDEEHGVGVMMLGSEAVYSGECDVSFMEQWIPRPGEGDA